MQRTNPRVLNNLTRFLEGPGSRLINFVLLPLLVATALFLPPVSLLDRITGSGYVRISPEAGAVLNPDGAQVTFPVEALTEGRTSALLEAIPREQFLAGDAGADLRAAAESIPSTLVPKSPFYQILIKGAQPRGSIVTIPIPTDAEPWELLDLYEWDGTGWQFVPSHIIYEDEVIEARLGYVPRSVMVMQSVVQPAAVAADLEPGGAIPAGAIDALSTVYAAGLSLRGDGGFDGDPAALPKPEPNSTYAVVPTLRNWASDGSVRTDLFDNLLISPDLQLTQITVIEELAVAHLWPGVDIDYRGLDPNLADAYTQFIKDLADRLHAQGKTLSVRVEPPQQIAADRWDTGGYDWRTLAQYADFLLVPAPVDPKAWAAGGQAEALLAWAVGEAERSKVQFVLPGRSVEQAGRYLLTKSYSEALAPLVGEISLAQTTAAPGQQVQAQLRRERQPSALVLDDTIGMQTYQYIDMQGHQRTMWLENAASLSRKLSVVGRYNLGGVVLQTLLAKDSDPEIWQVTRAFQAGEVTARPSQLALAWRITSPTAGELANEQRSLAESQFVVPVPNRPGETVNIEAEIVDGGRPVLTQGRASLVISAPTPTPTPTPAPSAAQAPASNEPMARFDARVNIREGPGTAYNRIAISKEGDAYKIVGKNPEGTWWQLCCFGEARGWVRGDLVEVSGPVDQVPVATDIPPAPTPAPAAAASSPAAAAPAPSSAPPPAGAGSFGYGIQVAPWDLGAVVGQVQALGFNWVKVQVPWKDLEGSKGAINWGSLDGMVSTFNGAGLNFLVSIPKAPAWARAGQDLSVEGPPNDPNDMASFLGQLAARYCGRIQAVEVWNEQNLHYEWGNMEISPERYMQLLSASYRAIKAACPQMIVVSGALTPTGAPAPAAMDDFTYLERMYQAGLKNVSDAIGAHPSGFNVAPDVGWEQACDFITQQGSSYRGPCNTPHHSWSFKSTMEGYRNIMVKYGDANKRIWPTEFGWASGWTGAPGYEYANDNTLDEQAQWTVRAYQMMKAWGFVGPAFLWNLNYGVTNPGTELAQWGIIGRPAYNALAAMPK
jgi:hypothetical protein